MTTSAETISCTAVEAADLASVAAEWERLYAEHGDAPPFSHPAWYATWLEHFPRDDGQFLIFRSGEGDLVGVIPLAVDGLDAAGLGNYKIQDYSGSLVKSGWEQVVGSLLLETLAGLGVATLRLWGLPADSPLLAGFAAAAGSVGWTATTDHEAVAPVAEVGNDWDQFVSSLSKKDRHELRRKLRNLESAGTVTIETITDPWKAKEAVASLVRMMRDSHEGKIRFLTAGMESFFLDLGPAMAKAGSGRIWRLCLDGSEIAILLGFDGPRARYLYNSGYDPEYGHLAVGLLSKALAMKEGIAEGRSRFDFLRGDEDYKRRLGGVEQAIVTLTLSRG